MQDPDEDPFFSQQFSCSVPTSCSRSCKQGHDIVFLAQNREWHAPPSDWHQAQGVRDHIVMERREKRFIRLRRFETCVLQGQAVYRACEQLKQEGWEPDWIINHVGFGNGLYLSDAFPASKDGLFEWYYNSRGADVDFLRQGPLEPDRALRLRTWNAQTLLEIADCDCGVVPTQWQLDQFPTHLRSRLRVIHEGIDVETLAFS